MKFNPIPENPLEEHREVEMALHDGMCFEVQTTRRYRKVRAFYKRLPWKKVGDPVKYFVYNIKTNTKVN